MHKPGTLPSAARAVLIAGFTLSLAACGGADTNTTGDSSGIGGTSAFGGGTAQSFGGMVAGIGGGTALAGIGGRTSVAGFGGATSAAGGLSATGGATTSGTAVTAAPKWSEIYAQYFAAGKAGHCVDCHTFGASASALYSHLSAIGEINGPSSTIVVSGSSMLIWFGGSMPQGGTASNPSAVAALKAWVAAGALNN